MSKTKRAKQLRFIVNGDAWVRAERGWQVKCSRCPKTKLFVSSHGKILPPEAVIKKLTLAGWYIGTKAPEDICKECQRKPEKPQSNIAFAKQVIAGITAPVVQLNGRGVHFNDLLVAAKALEPDQARELINALREQIPKRPPPKQKPPPPQPESDTDYQRWLNEQK